MSVSPFLKKEIKKKFKKESIKVIRFLMGLKDNHHKGDLLTQIGGVLIKEIKYKGFRFYYVVDNYRLKLFDEGELRELLIKFVRMSSKKTQQKIIDGIKEALRRFGDV